MFRKICALILALSLALTAAAFASVDGIPFTDETVEMSVVVDRRYNSGDPENIWFWKFAEQFMGIRFDVELTEDADLFKQLSFAAGTMPDLFINMQLTASEQMTYGAAEHQLVAVDQYVNEEYMPNLTAVFEEHPDWRAMVTAADGHMYSFNRYAEEPDAIFCQGRYYLNERRLKEMGKEMPTTLEELIDVLYAFKALGEDKVPWGCSNSAYNCEGYILNAMGYLSYGAYSVGLKNGEVMFPFGDREGFSEFVRLMNQFYADGIISPDFYTLDNTAVSSMIAEDRTLLIGQAPYVFVPNSFKDWNAGYPLTSQYSGQQQWLPSSDFILLGSFAISSNCDENKLPVALKFADWAYQTENYVFMDRGPLVSDPEEWKMGMTSGWSMDENRYEHLPDVEAGNSGFASEYDYKMGVLKGWHDGWGLWTYGGAQTLQGYENIGKQYNLDDGDDYYRYTCMQNLVPYVVEEYYPNIVFFTAEETERISDLSASLKAYSREQVAAFVTGARSLDELPAYFDALDAMGYQEYLKYYVDYYQQYKNQ